MVISDFFHLRLGGGGGGGGGGEISNIATASRCFSSRPAFPTGPSVCWGGGGGGGGGGGQQASSLSSTHKLWNFHRYSLVYYIIASYGNQVTCGYMVTNVMATLQVWSKLLTHLHIVYYRLAGHPPLAENVHKPIIFRATAPPPLSPTQGLLKLCFVFHTRISVTMLFPMLGYRKHMQAL